MSLGRLSKWQKWRFLRQEQFLKTEYISLHHHCWSVSKNRMKKKIPVIEFSIAKVHIMTLVHRESRWTTLIWTECERRVILFHVLSHCTVKLFPFHSPYAIIYMLLSHSHWGSSDVDRRAGGFTLILPSKCFRSFKNPAYSVWWFGLWQLWMQKFVVSKF